MRKLRAGIIGTGFIAATAHIPALLNLQDSVEIVAAADDRPEAVREAGERFRIPHIYTDPYKMLQENQLDLVHVCTANNTHKAFSIAALRAGANVLCEKPFALTLADAREMFDEAHKAGRKLIACQNLRMGAMQDIRDIIASGILGDLYFVEIEMLRRRGVPTWGRFHVKADSGAGCLCDVGVHFIDAALYAMGNPKPKAVCAFTNNALATKGLSNQETAGVVTGDKPFVYRKDYDYRDFDVEDIAGGMVSFENGLQMMFKCSWAINIPISNYYRFAGTKGGLVYDRGSGRTNPVTLSGIVNGYMADTELQIPSARPDAMQDVGHRALIRHIVEDVLIGGKDCVIREEETLNVVSIIEAVYRSARLGRSVEISEL